LRLSDSHQLSSLARHELQRPLVISLTLALLGCIACADFLFADVDIISHLYYLPILLAATQLGRRPAIAVAAAAVVLTHLGDPDLAHFRYGEADVMELVLFVTVAIVASGWSQTERELRRLASTDDLTGLHNLRSFEAIARDLIERERRAQGAVAVICLDADRLKQLNDTYGHLTGADAVRHIGKVIAEVLHEGASACRYGGDEFAIVVGGKQAIHAAGLALRIQEAVAAAAPVLDTQSFPAGTLSVSAGCALADLRADAPAPAIFAQSFRQADQAMYANKRKRAPGGDAPASTPRVAQLFAVPSPSARTEGG
jgi:diguanylate cyclase (GGDEF)-like protein